MPLVVMQRCAHCRDMLARSAFPNRVVGKLPSGKPKRVFSAYCQQCLEDDPKLYRAFDQQAADAQK